MACITAIFVLKIVCSYPLYCGTVTYPPGTRSRGTRAQRSDVKSGWTHVGYRAEIAMIEEISKNGGGPSKR
jgi:hypothetical protein